MTTWLLQAAAYALLGAAVLAVNWHRSGTRVAGAALLAFSLISSATFFLGLPFHGLVLREVLLITPIATICAYLFMVGDGVLCYRVAVGLCALDVGFCGAIFLTESTTDAMQSLFGWVVNLNFVGLCACVATPGIADAYRRWIDSIERVRRLDSSAPDFDWALRNLDQW